MLRVILHIGQHKTGSKALQSALYANRSYLAEKGFAYPVPAASAGPLRPWQMNHHGLFEAVRDEARADGRSTAGPGVREWLSRIIECCAPAVKTMVLSAEDLFDMHTAHDLHFEPALVAAGSRLLAREVADFADDVSVVCYLRRQDHLLAAHYAQFIKGTSTHHPTLEDFGDAFAPRLDAASILDHWDVAFGSSAVTVAPYEPSLMPGGIVADFFSRALCLAPPAVTVPYPDDLEAFNVTPTRDHIEFMRCLNRRSSRGRPVVPRAHVLDAAFHDRARGAAGIAAWLSPGERLQLLERYEPGNQRIAASHGIQGGLFRESLPAGDERWEAPPPPGLHRLVELDAMARAVAMERAGGSARVRPRGTPRRALWIISPQATPADEALAAELYGGIAGHPGLESFIRSELGRPTLLGWSGRVALVVFVGPTAGGWTESALVLGLRVAGVRVVRVQGGAIRGPGRLHVQAGQAMPYLRLDGLIPR